MERRGLLGGLVGLLAAVPVIHRAAAAEPAAARPHRVAFQVSSGDAASMNLALGNAKNVADHYAAQKEAVAIEIVAYGPGLTMLRADTSPVKERIATLHESLPAVRLSACANTKRSMEKAEGKEVTLLPAAIIVPSGAVRLSELQEQGWSYIRP